MEYTETEQKVLSSFKSNDENSSQIQSSDESTTNRGPKIIKTAIVKEDLYDGGLTDDWHIYGRVSLEEMVRGLLKAIRPTFRKGQVLNLIHQDGQEMVWVPEKTAASIIEDGCTDYNMFDFIEEGYIMNRDIAGVKKYLDIQE